MRVCDHSANLSGLKSAAVIRRFTHNSSLVETAKNAVNWTLTYHGAASGTIIGDERIVGLSPHSGSELCTSVELMYSLSYLHHATGDPYYADKAEIAAFNSLPAMFTPDYWAHQYVQAANQASAKNYSRSPFYNTNSWSQTFGLEPHYPCCTVNHPQGWPKFLSHAWATVGNDGIAHTLLSPGTAKALLRSGEITVEAITAYPFTGIIDYVVSAKGPAKLYLRVPSWARKESSITIESNASTPLKPDPATRLHKVPVAAGTTKISYSLQSVIRTEARANGTISVFKGALLYAVEVKHTRTSTRPKTFRSPHDYHDNTYALPQVKDYEYKSAMDWRLAIDPWTLRFHKHKFMRPSEISNPIFAEGANSGHITVQGCKIDWPSLEEGVPGDVPPLDGRRCIGEAFEVKLIPYGSAKLHIADIPVIDIRQPGE